MTTIQSFADLGEDLDLIWLAGFREDAERGWLVRAVTRGLNSGTLHQHWLPIGLLPRLAPGRCFVGGDHAAATRRGGVMAIVIEDVAAGEEVTSGAVPPAMIGIDDAGHKRGVQRLFRYRWNGMDVLVPAIEMVRFLFAHTKTMANALMRPGGLMELCRPEQPGFHLSLHLHFTARMPVSVLKPPFVAEFAWTAVHPEGRRAWDSVAACSTGRSYVLFRPPRLVNSHWTVRAVQDGSTMLVLEILAMTGKEHPCSVLRYSHPSIHPTAVPLRKPATPEEPEAPSAPRPVRERVDYVVDDRAGATRTDVHQSALPAPAKLSSFDRIIEVIRVTGTEGRPADAGGAGGSDQAPASPRAPATNEAPHRRQVRVRAGITEEGAGARLPPIEFDLLEPAEPGYTGSLEPLTAALHQMAALAPHIAIAMAVCVLKGGRTFSYTNRHRRPCLVAVIQAPSRPPMVLLDVDHADGVALSSLALTFHHPVPFRVMEAPIKTLLDRLVANGGHWDMAALEPFTDTCGCFRLPKVLRYQERMEQAAYHKAWAMRLIDRLGIGEA